jgi:2-dehydropantoate 2-reductase
MQWVNSPHYIALHNEEYGDCIRHHVETDLARSPYRRHNKIITAEERRAEGLWKPHYDEKPAGQFLSDEPPPPNRSKEPIEHLILAEKPQHVVSQLLGVRHRLGAHSTILFVTPTLGIMEEVMLKIFPDPSARPKFMLGEFTHSVKRPLETREFGHNVAFQLMHSRIGSLFITQNPLFSGQETAPVVDGEESIPAQTDYLTKTLLRTPRLSALELPPLELHMRLLDAIARRSVIQPLTTMMDTSNGALMFNFHITRAMRLLIAETSLILRSLPELRGHPNVETRYGPDRLERIIVGIIRQTWTEYNETLIDVKRGFKTDVDYSNGYIIARAQQLGLKAFMNFMMQELVKGKSSMIARENTPPVKSDDIDADEIFMDD